MNFSPISFILAFIITFILTPWMRRVALRLKVLDHPDRRKIHLHPIPLLGSVAVYLGFMVGTFLSRLNFFLQKEILIVFSAGTMLLVVGVLDCGHNSCL